MTSDLRNKQHTTLKKNDTALQQKFPYEKKKKKKKKKKLKKKKKFYKKK